MKRDEKNALSRRRILDAALKEFSEKGYHAASLNTICAENEISKGIIYHYFESKDELYLLCASECFEKLTICLREVSADTGTIRQRLNAWFDARLRFFAENPVYLGIFLSVVMDPPTDLTDELALIRKPFDELNISNLISLLRGSRLRKGISLKAVAEDFRMYMDYFNARFRGVMSQSGTPEQALREHEERCHRQIEYLLYGILEK